MNKTRKSFNRKVVLICSENVFHNKTRTLLIETNTSSYITSNYKTRNILCLLFNPEDGGSTFLQNISIFLQRT
jgi:hypothetical protein